MQEGIKTVDYVADEPQTQTVPENHVDQAAPPENVDDNDTGSELIPLGSLSPADVFKKDSGHIDDLLKKIRERVQSEFFDISTAEGQRRIRSVARKIGSTKTKLKEMSKELTEEWRIQTKAVTEEASRMEREFDKLRDEHLQPLKEWEARQEKMKAGIENFVQLARFDDGVELTVDELNRRIQEVVSDETEWGDFKARAEHEKKLSLAALERKLEEVKKRDAERAELERLRREEEERQRQKHEAEIAEKAAAEARMLAEQKAEEERKAAERKAAEEKAAALKAAEDKAEAERAAAAAALKKAEEEREAALKAAADERARVEAEKAAAEKRAADLEHKKKINTSAATAVEAILKTGMYKDGDADIAGAARAVITAIAKGEIPHVRIEY